MTEDEEDAWRLEQREVIQAYLAGQGVEHGEIGEWPAWDTPPYIAIWAIESRKAPGCVGWWVVSGDLPTDYCSAKDCRHPRLAMRRIAESWRDAVASQHEGGAGLAELGLPAFLAPLLEARVKLLLEFAGNDELWEEEGPRGRG